MKGHTTTHEENKARLARIEGQVRAVSHMIASLFTGFAAHAADGYKTDARKPVAPKEQTTILALPPILTSTGRGSDIMVPMAIPNFGGMLIESVTMLVVPVLYCALQERRLKAK